MKLLICDSCQGVWAYENHDEDVTIHTICDYCREKETRRQFEEEKKLLKNNPRTVETERRCYKPRWRRPQW